jgi:hypothetical protein
MAANSSLGKEGTGTLPLAIFVVNCIVAIFAAEISGKIKKGNTLWFSCVSFGFFDLPD